MTLTPVDGKMLKSNEFSFVIQVNPNTSKTELFLLSLDELAISQDVFSLTPEGVIGKAVSFLNSDIFIKVHGLGHPLHDKVCLMWIDNTGGSKKSVESPVLLEKISI